MAPRKDKLKQTIAEDRKRLLLRARKWPFANLMMAATGACCLMAGNSISGGAPAAILVGGVVGLILAGGLQKVFQKAENQISARLYDLASQIEIVEQADAKEKAAAPNALLDEFSLDYCGGHPTWQVNSPVYGTLQVFERSVVFKNLKNRFRMPMARINRLTVESLVQVRVKKLPDVVLPNAKMPKRKAFAKLFEPLRKRQRYLVLDYTDDSGNQRMVIFWPRGGNPRSAKQVKEGFDSILRKSAKDRDNRQAGGTSTLGTGALPPLPAFSPPPVEGRTPRPKAAPLPSALPITVPKGRGGGLQEVSQDIIEAAKRASMEGTGHGSAPVPQVAVPSGRPCPYCKFSLKEPTVICSVCGAEHHEGCWKANFGCTTKDCRGKAIPKDSSSGATAAASTDSKAAAAAGSTAASMNPERVSPAAEPQAAASRGSTPGLAGGAQSARAHVATAPEIKYQVILTSAGQSPAETEAIAVQMADLFGVPVDKCRAVLQSIPAVARRNITHAEAEALAARFVGIGAQATIEPLG